MRRSKRFEKLDTMPINYDGVINEWKEVGLVTMTSPFDPKPSIKVEDGLIIEMDGVTKENFDSIDYFIATHGINAAYAEEAMAIDSLEIARMLVDINVEREAIVKICNACTPAKLLEVLNHLNVVEMMMAQMKMRVRKTPANQSHATNVDDNPVLIAADAAEQSLRGFSEIETTAALARYAPFNAIAMLIGSQSGKAGALTQCSMEEATELELGMRGFTSYAETLSVYGTEAVMEDGGDTAYSKAFLASAYASRGIKNRYSSGTGSEVLMGNAEQKSALYLELRCLFYTKACGIQGSQNGSLNAMPLMAALPDGFRAITAESLAASMLGLEVVSGNDTAFTHSDFRRGAKLVMTMMPGTDFVCSGFGGIPNLDNVFAGSNEDCDDYDDVYRLQRDMKVDGGIEPATEEDIIRVRNTAAKAMQSIFYHLDLPEITDEEVEMATYGYSSQDMPKRDKAADMKAAGDMMKRGTNGLDLVKILYEDGFVQIAENVLELLKQRITGDYLHASSIFDENFKIKNGLTDPNDYMGPGTGYRVSDERWEKLKENYRAMDPQKVAQQPADGAMEMKVVGTSQTGDNQKEIIIALSPAFGNGFNKNIKEIYLEEILDEICAGIEEEGMAFRIIKVYDSTDLAIIADTGAKLAGSGISIGIQSRGTTVIHHKDQVPLDNLELFPQCPLYDLDFYRRIGRNAAKYGKGESPVPLEVLNDYMVPSKYLAKSMLMHLREVEYMNSDRKAEDVVI